MSGSGTHFRDMAFRKIHEDKAVSMDTRCLFEWCPTMDLLAFVTNENHIVLHRLSWAKLGSFFEHSSPVTALAWSPDGRTLASGHDDGRIVLYDIELQETLGSVAVHSARVTALTWATWLGGGGGLSAPPLVSMQDRAGKFMPPVIPLVDGGGGSASSSRANLRFADARKPHEMTVLLSGDASGVLSLRALGASCIGSVQIFVPAEGSSTVFGAEIEHISAAPDLSRVAVVLRTTAADPSEHRSPEVTQVHTAPDTMAHVPGTQYLAAIDSSTVAANASQLLQISAQSCICEAAIAGLHASLRAMVKAWKDAWEHMRQKLSTLAQGLQAHGSCSTPESELLTCVASGCASPGLQQFLSSLREQVAAVGCTCVVCVYAHIHIPHIHIRVESQ